MFLMEFFLLEAFLVVVTGKLTWLYLFMIISYEERGRIIDDNDDESNLYYAENSLHFLPNFFLFPKILSWLKPRRVTRI